MLEYNIEDISILEEENHIKIALRGWIFSDKPYKIEGFCKEKCIAFDDFESFYRKDINEYFDVCDEKKRGFIIKLLYTKKEIKISFTNDIGEQKDYILTKLEEKVRTYKKNKNSNKILRYLNVFYLKKSVHVIQQYGIKYAFSLIKNRMAQPETKETEKSIYQYDYCYKDKEIPAQWLEIQKIKPLFLIYTQLESWNEATERGLRALSLQTYKSMKLYIDVKNQGVKKEIIKFLAVTSIDVLFIDEMQGELKMKDHSPSYFLEISLYDCLVKNALAHMMEVINLEQEPMLLYSAYDHFEEEGKYHTCISKRGINKITLNCIIRGAWCVKYEEKLDFIFTDINRYLESIIDDLCSNKTVYIDKVLLHRNINVKNDKNKKIKAIAFYLPQFHCFPENDKWWGEGFTEWRNVKRTIPMFEDHNQPRIPGELGYYNLMEQEEIQYKQEQLAKEYGIYGFCYYYYWFNGKRLLERPLDKKLNNIELDLPFCFCWANENWTKRWDGLQNEILMEQVHEQDSDERFIKDVANMLKDSRYIRINNKPLILIYKINLLADGKKTIQTWREQIENYGIDGIYIALVKQEGIIKPQDYGADALVEFPPHNMDAKNITQCLNTKKDFMGNIYDYSEMANRKYEELDYTIFKGAMLQWDNTARRMEKADIFHNFSSYDYKKWLLKNREYALLHNDENEQLIFINAWNEWAEGTYLEPDEEFGKLHLDITKQIVESR